MLLPWRLFKASGSPDDKKIYASDHNRNENSGTSVQVSFFRMKK